jgi:hypothetical protein
VLHQPSCAGDPREFFYGEKRAQVQTSTSFDQKLRRVEREEVSGRRSRSTAGWSICSVPARRIATPWDGKAMSRNRVGAAQV